eukprot:478272-Pyramimonas_sp.AAC.1
MAEPKLPKLPKLPGCARWCQEAGQSPKPCRRDANGNQDQEPGAVPMHKLNQGAIRSQNGAA